MNSSLATNKRLLTGAAQCNCLSPLSQNSHFVAICLVRRYPAKSCAELEDVRLSWCPHLLEVEALLLKIRKAGVGGQVREATAGGGSHVGA